MKLGKAKAHWCKAKNKKDTENLQKEDVNPCETTWN